MSPKLQWMCKPSSAIQASIVKVGTTTMLITKTPGPLSFLLHDAGSEEDHKVGLGDNHQCDCVVFRRTQEPCVHICWLLMKKFKVDPQDEIMFQKGLNESHLQSLFNMEKYHETKKEEKRKQLKKRVSSKKRILTRDDECPICFDKFFQSGKGITQCSTCHNHVHIPCRNLWKRNGDADTRDRCPYCRGNFGVGVSVHLSLIPWKKQQTQKPSSANGDPSVIIHKITKRDIHFMTEFVKGVSLTEKVEVVSSAPPTGRFTDWTKDQPSSFVTSSSSFPVESSKYPSTNRQTRDFTVAGRGLLQFNSTQQETGPTREPPCEPLKSRRSRPHILGQTVLCLGKTLATAKKKTPNTKKTSISQKTFKKHQIEKNRHCHKEQFDFRIRQTVC